MLYEALLVRNNFGYMQACNYVGIILDEKICSINTIFVFQMVADGSFRQLTSQAVVITEGWTVAQLLSIYSGGELHHYTEFVHLLDAI
jgi:hypothetical protein